MTHQAKLLILWICLIAFLAACGGNDSDSDPENAVVPTQPIVLVLQSEALPQTAGEWVLDATTVNREERQIGLVLTATFVNPANQARGGITLTAYTTYEEARKVFDERVAAWQADSSQTVEAISSLGDGSYTLNETQSAIALVDGNGIVQVDMADPSLATHLELLSLLQVGVNVLRERELPVLANGGTLGNATLAPPNP